jgi:hypothetical protein
MTELYFAKIKIVNNIIEIGYYKNLIELNKNVFSFLVNKKYLLNNNIDRKNLLLKYNVSTGNFINNLSTDNFINIFLKYIENINIIDFCKKNSNEKWELIIESARIQ